MKQAAVLIGTEKISRKIRAKAHNNHRQLIQKAILGVFFRQESFQNRNESVDFEENKNFQKLQTHAYKKLLRRGKKNDTNICSS